jgi:hypothetical protein
VRVTEGVRSEQAGCRVTALVGVLACVLLL